MEKWERLTACSRETDGMVRYAAMAWEIEGGVLWIEPHYLDPYSCNPAMHIAPGIPQKNGDEMRCGEWTFVGLDESEASTAQRWWLDEINGDIEAERARLEKITPELSGKTGG